MAFLRFTRDRRGYEHFYLVQPTSGRRGKGQPRVLYFFRTPPNIRVGREPFDEHIRRTLEAQNPGVDFDWAKILETPIPPADPERWRERRRAERAGKAARRAGLPEEEREPSAENPDEPFESEALRAEESEESGSSTADAKPPHDTRQSAVRKRRRRRVRIRPDADSGTQAAERGSDSQSRSDEDLQ